MRAFRSLTIRQWFFGGLIVTGVIPFITVIVFIFVYNAIWLPASGQAPTHYEHVIAVMTHHLVEDSQQWRDPAWQNSLSQWCHEWQVKIIIKDGANDAIFHCASNQSFNGPDRTFITLSAMGQLTAELYVYPSDFSWTPYLALLLAMLLADLPVLLFLSWLIGRALLRPLAAMRHSARQIASGELDFTIPPSRVREVAEVSGAFTAMGRGLREAITRQAKLEEERRLFVGAIAHDLRTPLFALRSYLEGIASGVADSPEKVQQYLAVCRDKAEALERLIADLFAFTRLEYLDASLQRDTIDVGDFMTRRAEEWSARAEQKRITIQVQGETAPAPLIADAQSLTRVVDNLLDNAVRYTPISGPIFVRWWYVPTQLVFTVADIGPGLSAMDLQHLFEPLYRGDASRNRATGGIGLGLAIARRIIQAHGGEIAAHNGPEGGAIFTITLPLDTPPTFPQLPDGGEEASIHE